MNDTKQLRMSSVPNWTLSLAPQRVNSGTKGPIQNKVDISLFWNRILFTL